MRTLQEISADYQQKIGELKAFKDKNFDAAKGSAKFAINSAEHTEFLGRDTELNGLFDELEAARKASNILQTHFQREDNLNQPQDGLGYSGGSGSGVKSVGELYVASQAYKSGKGESKPNFRVDFSDVSAQAAMKATLTTTTGFAPRDPRQPIVVPYANRALTIADLLPSTQTEVSTWYWMEQTDQTNNADTVAENAVKPESAYAWAERNTPLQVIAHYLPVTKQQLEDVPGIRDLIDQELMYGLRFVEENKLLNGTGTSPDIQGLLTKGGVQTQAKGSLDTFTAIMSAFTKIRGTTPGTGFANVNMGVMHPNDWLDLATTQDTTGRFIYGDPSASIEPRVWGVPLVITPAITENTALFGDSMYARVIRKGGVSVETGYINDDMIKNKLTILVEERIALAISRASAFCKVTGI